jgi:hypothetical protein
MFSQIIVRDVADLIHFGVGDNDAGQLFHRIELKENSIWKVDNNYSVLEEIIRIVILRYVKEKHFGVYKKFGPYDCFITVPNTQSRPQDEIVFLTQTFLGQLGYSKDASISRVVHMAEIVPCFRGVLTLVKNIHSVTAKLSR